VAQPWRSLPPFLLLFLLALVLQVSRLTAGTEGFLLPPVLVALSELVRFPLQLVGVGFREGDDAVLFDIDLREGWVREGGREGGREGWIE